MRFSGPLEAVLEEGGSYSLDDMRRSLILLKEKLRKQTRVVLKWKARYTEESRLVATLTEERNTSLQAIQSQLLAFESSLKKGRREFEHLVRNKDDIISRQQRLICDLTLALLKRGGQEDVKKLLPGLKVPSSPELKTDDMSSSQKLKEEEESALLDTLQKRDGVAVSPAQYDALRSQGVCNTLQRHESGMSPAQYDALLQRPGVVLLASSSSSKSDDAESLNDSDSAIMMEDSYDALVVLPSSSGGLGTKGQVKVMRSVSDALELIARTVSDSVDKPLPTTAGGTTNRRQQGGGSLSSTPSCSSEDSDHSPPSTIHKGRGDLNAHHPAGYCCSLPNPLSSSTPNVYPVTSNTNATISDNTISNNNYNNSSSSSSNKEEVENINFSPWTVSQFVSSSKSNASYDKSIRPSPILGVQPDSSSSTPVVSPSQTPPLSPSATPPMSLKRCDERGGGGSSALEKSKYALDSDATLSDGQSDDGEDDDDGDSGLGSRYSGGSPEFITSGRPPFGTVDILNHSNTCTPRRPPIGIMDPPNHPDFVTQNKPLFRDLETVTHPEKGYKKKASFGLQELNPPVTGYRSRAPKDELIQVTYNRVMSNHRSVTKPKDVKYKRINKAKSRSLEELRGKLKLSDKKQFLAVDLDQSEA